MPQQHEFTLDEVDLINDGLTAIWLDQLDAGRRAEIIEFLRRHPEFAIDGDGPDEDDE